MAALSTTTIAHANGRFPATSSIQLRTDHDADIVLGMTFGMVVTHDAGAHWQWLCEAAVGYGGTYDPQFAWLASGALLATTQSGLRITHDGCAFAPVDALGAKFVSAIARGPDSALYVGASSPDDANLYHSTDDGVTFARQATPVPPERSGRPSWSRRRIARASTSRGGSSSRT